MVYRTRIKYTTAQKAGIWGRWQRSRLALMLVEHVDVISEHAVILHTDGQNRH